MVRHQLPLPGPRDRARDHVLAEPGQGARRAERGARARDSGPPGRHRAGHLPAAEQGRQRRRRADRAARRAAADLRRAAVAARRRRRAVGAARRAGAGDRHLARRARAGRGGVQRAGRGEQPARASTSPPTSATPAPPWPGWPARRSRRSASTWSHGADTAVAGGARAGRQDPGGRRRRRAQHLAHRPGVGAGQAGDPAGFGGQRRGLDVVLDAARAVLAGARNRPGRRAAQLAGVRAGEGRRGGDAGARRCTTDATRSPTRSRHPTPPWPRARATRGCTTTRSGPGSTRSSRRARTAATRPSAAPARTTRLHLPPLPTTTIGSYPQTSAIRKARAALRAGEIDEAEYDRPDAAGDRRRHRAAGATRPRRAGARRAGAQRHGAVLRRAARRLLRHRERLGAVLRQPLRAAADPLRRRHPPSSR